MSNIVIVDYGMGNLTSIANAFQRLKVDCVISADPQTIKAARGLVLPGVGAFHAAMTNLDLQMLRPLLHEQISTLKKPVLGICLGMQLFADHSAENGLTTGLAWIPGDVIKIPKHPHYPTPHVGWNTITFDSHNALFTGIPQHAHFYFDHNFHYETTHPYITAQCEYSSTFVAAIQKENMYAVQFHPEKSQRNGAKLLRNFANIVQCQSIVSLC